MITITKVSLENIIINPDDYNSNNHWDNGQPPDDYQEVINRTNCKNWIDKFHITYKTIILDKFDLRWMSKAFQIGKITGYFPKTYIEELEDCIIKHRHQGNCDVFDGTMYFARTESTSLKYGMYGTGPYTNLRQIIESMVTSIQGHHCCKDTNQECKIYLMNWIENMEHNKEFRIFVYHNRITVISQQHVNESNKWLANKSDNQIKEIVIKIIIFFENNIKQKMSNIQNYVMDLALIGKTEQPYFIEGNSFGKQYAAASALFHWLRDEPILYNNINNDVVFRYVSD
jgi:hypothetical protein